MTDGERLSSEATVTRLVQRENERLTRLLRNLYQEFRLGRGDRSRLYEHICRELAQYFQCDCCQLYLVRQEPDAAGDGDAQPREMLELVAAFGPWEQALSPRFVRRALKTQYRLESRSHTAQVFRQTYSRADLSRLHYRSTLEGRDSEWHLVWHRHNLYTISRNMLSCPILRHRSLSSRHSGDPYPVGVVKLENKRPLLSRAFNSDFETSRLYLGEFFKLFAVAGYIRDLQRRVLRADAFDALFAPLHDSDGWRQHYQEHDAGSDYFEVIRSWQSEEAARLAHSQQDLESVRHELSCQYEEAEKQLSELMNLVVEVEVLLQEVATACCAIWKDKAPREFVDDLERLPAHAPAPSLFHAVGLAKAGQVPEWLGDVVATTLERIAPGCRPEAEPAECCRTLVCKLTEQTGPLARPRQDPREGLWPRLAAAFRRDNTRLSMLFQRRHRDLLAKNMCKWMRSAAIEVRNRYASVATMALTPSLSACFHSADGILAALGKKGDDPISRLAEASAAACMHAHTFNPRVDGVRLYSIQSHVAQVLDNYLMDKARISGLGVSFNHVEMLGLTESSLSELERLQKLLADVARSLESVVRRHLAARHPDEATRTTIRTTSREVSALLDELVSSVSLSTRVEPWLGRADVSCETGAVGADTGGRFVTLEDLDLRVPAKLGVRAERERITVSYEGDAALSSQRRPTPLWLRALNDSLQDAVKMLLNH